MDYPRIRALHNICASDHDGLSMCQGKIIGRQWRIKFGHMASGTTKTIWCKPIYFVQDVYTKHQEIIILLYRIQTIIIQFDSQVHMQLTQKNTFLCVRKVSWKMIFLRYV
jgi:hypothetical protein